MGKLLIVESPNKVGKIKGFLGPGWDVAASVGHIRDLPKDGVGIDKANGYKMQYVISEGKHKVVKDLKEKVKTCGPQNVYLATDPDREGEAISFHLCQALGLDYRTTHRVTFQEITSEAVQAAVQNPRRLDMPLVLAQETRRAVDRLVGYEISPVLWRKLTNVKSAGRVQSPAVRLIVEREREIAGFTDKYTFGVWGIFGTPKGELLPAVRTTSFNDGQSAQQYLRSTQGQRYAVREVTRQPVERNPPAAYSTSTLQQDGVKKLKFTVNRVSEVAQALFEAGHITYIRTDSVNLSDSAIAEAKGQIVGQYGAQYLHERRFKNKAGAQEAHEAIRPTHWENPQAGATDEQQRLYQLIYNRALASQMSAARYDETRITLGSALPDDEYASKTRVLVFDGYLRVYQDAQEEDEEEDTPLLKHPVQAGDALSVQQLEARQTYSKPPRRFDQATLVGELEKRQIGRPSTYASIIDNITTKKGYITTGTVTGKQVKATVFTLADGQITQRDKTVTLGADKGKLLPSPTGTDLVVFLEQNFAQVVDYRFTARCEAIFDEIAQGTNTYQSFLPKFDKQLAGWLAQAETKYKDVPDAGSIAVGKLDGLPITAGKGKFGTYVKYQEQYFSIEKLAPEAVTMPVAIAAIRAKQENGKREIGKYQGKPIVACKNEKGTYLLWEKQFFNVDAGMLPGDISEQLAQQFISQGVAKQQENVVATIGKTYSIRRGQYGLYLTDRKTNAGLKKDVTEAQASSYTEQQCKELIDSYKKWKAKQK
ncbi:type I DNA topoisomerase [Hymenobacter defluvii]|uniref:DNA topoisomerase 1 n=1 Tax=Hymenobacter defluvii TaxID=2054411 RepID=A0ABS3TFK6_9BACT|nr:type I DNA topoisomerase [Hymenobacter defluvii]MBO3272153.1 type I DNA topoisomerase [Hymenobacter defluvii]